MPNLAPDAFLKARERFLETGDVRYAAIAIGKAPIGDYPTWALDACRTYAASIGNTPSRFLGKGRDLNGNATRDDRAYEDLIQCVLTAWRKQEPFNYADAVREVVAKHVSAHSQGEEALRQALRRRWREDLDPVEHYTAEMEASVETGDLSPPADEANRHRRVRALFVMRGRGLEDR